MAQNSSRRSGRTNRRSWWPRNLKSQQRPRQLHRCQSPSTRRPREVSPLKWRTVSCGSLPRRPWDRGLSAAGSAPGASLRLLKKRLSHPPAPMRQDASFTGSFVITSFRGSKYGTNVRLASSLVAASLERLFETPARTGHWLRSRVAQSLDIPTNRMPRSFACCGLVERPV